jgi:hypothetical protein
MFAESIIRAKASSLTPPGSVRSVSALQWTALSQIYRTASDMYELKKIIQSHPWEIAVYSNPQNLSPKQLATQLSSTGGSSLFKIIIKKLPEEPINNQPQGDQGS